MKKEYIKPAVTGIITLTVESLLDAATKTLVSPEQQNPGQNVGTDNSPEGSEVDAAAKGFNAWTAWDD